LVLGGTIAYMSDIGFATDTGLNQFKPKEQIGGEIVAEESIKSEGDKGSNVGSKEWGTGPTRWENGFNYTFGTLITSQYYRFIMVTLIDTFISLMIFSVAFPKIKRTMPFQCMPSVANGFVSSCIAVISFQAYTNMTRFLWAYPDEKLDQSQIIQTPLILLILAVSAVTFLHSNTMYDLDIPGSTTIAKQGINHPTIKLIIVIIAFVLASILVVNRLDKYSNRDKNQEQLDASIGETIANGSTGKKVFLGICCCALFSTLATTKREGTAKWGLWIVCCLLFVAFSIGIHWSEITH